MQRRKSNCWFLCAGWERIIYDSNVDIYDLNGRYAIDRSRWDMSAEGIKENGEMTHILWNPILWNPFLPRSEGKELQDRNSEAGIWTEWAGIWTEWDRKMIHTVAKKHMPGLNKGRIRDQSGISIPPISYNGSGHAASDGTRLPGICILDRPSLGSGNLFQSLAGR